MSFVQIVLVVKFQTCDIKFGAFPRLFLISPQLDATMLGTKNTMERLSPLSRSKFSPLYQFVLSKQSKNNYQEGSDSIPESMLPSNKLRSRDEPILRQPQRTSLLVWCAAILCMVFIVLLIVFTVTVLVIYLVLQPKDPVFDTPAASLSSMYFNSPQFINADITFLANFSNSNSKLNVRFESVYVELLFSDSLIASQVLDSFSQRPGESRFISIHLQPHLPLNLAMELQNQGQKNRIAFGIEGKFRVKFKLGPIQYSESLHGKCQLEMTGPPNGFLINHSCSTSR